MGGLQSCADGRWTACEGEVLPSDETLQGSNGVDDDCNGLFDDGLCGEAEACVGSCCTAEQRSASARSARCRLRARPTRSVPTTRIAWTARAVRGARAGRPTRAKTPRPQLRLFRMGSVQEIVCVDWRDAPSETHDVFVDVDTGDEARECDEANNVVYLGEGFCGGIE